MEVITDRLYSWASIAEPDALQQALRISKLPIIYPHVSIMPDIHVGKGAAIGLVIPTCGAIIPAAVGVDIGCGMIALKTIYHIEDIHINEDHNGRPLSLLREAIERDVPLSAGNYNEWVRDYTRPRVEELEDMPGAKDAFDVAPNWPLQLGSLGSGNHFIEVTVDEDECIWLFLHSGSRGVGNKLANKYMKIARAIELKRKPRNNLGGDPDLAWLEEDEKEFWDYIRVLKWSQHFALLNRQEMMFRVVSCFEEWIDGNVDALELIQCHHNYTEEIPKGLLEEYHWTGPETIWLSRKGAIDASAGKLGLIPGSMADFSYVVEGKGNAEALWTAPHGAGRRLSRTKAKGEFTLESLTAKMEGIEWRPSGAFLDEHPEAYKPIGQVIEDAEPLVTIKHRFKQILNVKGDL